MERFPLESEAVDALLRIDSVDGRQVFRFLLKSLVDLENSVHKKRETAVIRAEEAIWGNAPPDASVIKHEQVMLLMYRRIIEEQVSGENMDFGAFAASTEAIDIFHPDLVESEDQCEKDQNKRETLVRRYQEAFYAQRDKLPDRYLELVELGEEERIVAGFLALVLERAGVAIDRTAIQDKVLDSGYEFMLAVENDCAERTRK